MNVFTFTGNLGKDAGVRNAGDSVVTGFSVAVKSGYGKSEQTIWVDVSFWGKRGEAVAPYLTKGQQVAVSGELSTREHEGKTYMQVRANDVALLGKREGGPHTPEKPQAASVFEDSEIPFN